MHWRLNRLIQNLKDPLVVQTRSHCGYFVNTGGGWPLDVILFIAQWYNNDDYTFNVFEINVLGLFTFKFKPSERWEMDC